MSQKGDCQQRGQPASQSHHIWVVGEDPGSEQDYDCCRRGLSSGILNSALSKHDKNRMQEQCSR